MKLFYSTASPYARSSQIVLREVGLDPESIEVAIHPFDNQPEFLNVNPLGKVPCLMTEDCGAIFDSEVIAQYLDASFNQARLYKPIQENWQYRTTYSLISGLLDLCVALRQEKMREAEQLKSDFWWQRFVSGIDRGMLELANRCQHLDDGFSLIDINLCCLIDYLKFRHPEININVAPISKRYQRICTRPSILETAPSD